MKICSFSCMAKQDKLVLGGVKNESSFVKRKRERKWSTAADECFFFFL